MSTASQYFIAFCREFDRLAGHVDSVVRVFIGLFSITIVALIFGQVFNRYVIPWPIVWLSEAAVFTAAYLGLWGSSTCLRIGYHLQVKLAWDMLPQGLGHILSLIVHTIMIMFCAFLIYYGYQFADMSRGQWSESATFPVFWAQLAMPTGGLLIGLQALALLLRELALMQGASDWRKSPRDDDEGEGHGPRGA